MQRRVRAYISGSVQGVFYRAATHEQAVALGLAGWVRNLPDGQVEVLAEGEAAKVEALLAWCRHGPPLARVEAMKVVEESPRGDCVGFEVWRG